MQQFRLLSDLHLEFGRFTFPRLTTDKETTLLLAGDIELTRKKGVMRALMQLLSNQFKHVVYVYGNHEYYDTNFGSADRLATKLSLEFDNVSILNNDVMYVDDVAVIGATLWTDFDKENPIIMNQINDRYNGLTDYQVIRKGQSAAPNVDASYEKITPSFILYKHYESREFIFNQIAKEKKLGRKVIVVSHHGPTWQSVSSNYICDNMNGGYVSDLSEEILNHNPEVWVHGHVHNSFDYLVGDTRVLCNPRGYYPSNLNKEFDGAFSFLL